jgi:HSP20 family protein
MTTALLEKKLTEDARNQAEEQEFFGPALMRNLLGDMWPFVEDMDPFFAGFGRRRRPLLRNLLRTPVVAPWTPTMEVFFDKGMFVVRAELPGVDKDAVKIEAVKGALTIQGERKYEKEIAKKGYFTTECTYGTFYRQIPLPDEAKIAETKAAFKNGVLEVTIPAPALEKEVPRQIEIK